MKQLVPISVSEPDLQLMSPMDQNAAPPPPSKKFRWHKLLVFLKKFWWIPLITTAAGSAIAIGLFFKTPPTFVSSGRLWETVKLRLPDGAAFSDDRDNYLGTQSELLRSSMLRQLTLNWLRANSTNDIILGEDGEPLWVDIQVYSTPKSSVYSIEARSSNPGFTPLYLNALMKQYLEYRRNVRLNVSRDTLASISEQVQKVERELKAAQNTLEGYERSNNFAVLQQESAVEAAYLAKLKTELSDYELQLTVLDTMGSEQRPAGAGGANPPADSSLAPLRTPPGSQSPYASGQDDASRQIELLKAQRQKLSKYLRPQHPKIVKLDEDIAHAQKLVDVYRRQNEQQVAAMRESLKLKIQTTKDFVAKWEAKISDSTTRLAAVNNLKETVARNQSLYDRLLSLLQNVDISRNIDQDTLAILEPASAAKRSYKEAKAKMAQAGLLGLMLGFGIIALLVWRDDRFSLLVEVTDNFGDNVIGQVPDISGLAKQGLSTVALLQDGDERHMYAESYRNLRSALLYLTVEGQRPRVLLITSAIPNEGKSTVATNLARAMAMGGSKVLLVDADLRKGHIHENLNLNSKPGLSELIQQPDDLHLFIQPTDIQNLFFLARGRTSRHPGDLLLSPAFDQLLQKFRERYDYVIIDSCPVFAADDASTLAPKTDGIVFIVRRHFSNLRMVREALNLLFQRRATVLGLILNRADATDGSYYAYKYSEYYAQTADDESGKRT